MRFSFTRILYTVCVIGVTCGVSRAPIPSPPTANDIRHSLIGALARSPVVQHSIPTFCAIGRSITKVARQCPN